MKTIEDNILISNLDNKTIITDKKEYEYLFKTNTELYKKINNRYNER